MGTLMPVINGKFYMNPAYGRAVNDDDAFAVGIIRLDKIKVVPKDTPSGPVGR
jgi:hypothetical protein